MNVKKEHGRKEMSLPGVKNLFKGKEGLFTLEKHSVR